MRQPLIACLIAACALAPASLLAKQVAVAPTADATAITAAVADPRRTPAFVARDRYRHPVETLAFFGIRPDMTVVDVLPGSGWYSEILAPMLEAKGRYIAAASPGAGRGGTEKMIASDPARYGKVALTTFDLKAPSAIAPPGTADAVLVFREVHNLLTPDGAVAKQAFADFYAALKPGGVLGIEEHRLPEDRPAEREGKSGYVKTSTVIRLATAAGFQLAGQSEVNANPKDSADYPDGVWTLPPVLTLEDKDRDKYLAIGESDRMTLKFVKPGG